jgi:transcriptional regulator of NAD metabolism
MTKKEIAVLLGIIQTAYPRFYANISQAQRDETVDLWYEMLTDTDLQTAKKAIKRLIATSKFPPVIAELREAISNERDVPLLDEGAAWEEVNRAILSYGYMRRDEAYASMSELTRQTVERMGWRTLCMSQVSNEMADRAHFFKIFGVLAKRENERRLIPQSPASEKLLSMTQEVGRLT